MKLATTVALSTLLSLAPGGFAGAQTARPRAVRFSPDLLLSSGQPASQPQIEPTITANPRDPKNLVAGYFGRDKPNGPLPCHAVFTGDAGATWGRSEGPPLFSSLDACFDPSLAADPKGTFYLAYLDSHVTPEGFITTTDIRVARSTDGGRSFADFSTPVVGGLEFGTPDPDKEWIAVDTQPHSPFRGTIYLSYTDFPTFDFMIKVSVSRDGGRSWSTPVIVSRLVDLLGPEGVQASEPVIAADGTVYVFYHDYNNDTMRTSIKFVISKDGGKSWSAPADAAADLPAPGFYLLNDGDPQFGTDQAFGIFSTSYPTAAVAPDGTLYVAWSDFPDGHCSPGGAFGFITCVNSDVRLAVSKDGGRSWSAPRKVHDDATATDQFLPWIATGPDGLLSLVWLDRRLDPDNVDYDLFYTNTADGLSFLPNLRVSTQTSRVDGTFNGGDYNNMVVTSEGIFPVWNDSRSNSVQIFGARGTVVP